MSHLVISHLSIVVVSTFSNAKMAPGRSLPSRRLNHSAAVSRLETVSGNRSTFFSSTFFESSSDVWKSNKATALSSASSSSSSGSVRESSKFGLFSPQALLSSNIFFFGVSVFVLAKTLFNFFFFVTNVEAI
jgi:hypothetical protein